MWVAAGSLLVAVVAIVAAGLSAWYARGQRDEARKARELLVQERDARAAAPWVLLHFQNDAFALTNTWMHPLFEVRIRAHGVPFVGDIAWPRIDPSATETFLIPELEVVRKVNVEVWWSDVPGAEQRRWMTVLPARVR